MKLKASVPYIEGALIPPFYLPVYKEHERYAIECWIFPLAPFVLFWRILRGVSWKIWNDLLEFQRLNIRKQS